MLSGLRPQRPEDSLSLYSFNVLSSEKAIRPSGRMAGLTQEAGEC